MGNFKTIHDVPRGLRSVRGVPLTLDQVNKIVAEAGPDGPEFARKLGMAKKKFEETHEQVKGHWVAGGAK